MGRHSATGRAPARAAEPDAAAPPDTGAPTAPRVPGPRQPSRPDGPSTRRGRKPNRRVAAGVAALATVLAVVLAVRFTGGGHPHNAADAAPGGAGRKRADGGAASRSDQRVTPPPGYDQAMALRYPLDAKLALGGGFDAVPGHDPAPGRGQVLRYRVDVEQGLPLDGRLFADAVQKTLNDDRSWGHGGTRTFERISSGTPDFVITLASPVTTGKWCAKSGLDTLDENVSCDSAATDRVMINAYRWAQGSDTYGPDKMHMYRQMLINHEVGHRLGHNHEQCDKQGALAPVMMQQTKFLSTDGRTCRPNPWPFPAEN
ncbi:DUF3152 domain-containing protein [Streptomyces silvisoli]|uniref:DUF3152 domain-containing protein n=1 Tax=Streptomyces silvisoli TaxID=3034235 RepID=UPI00370377BB